MRYLIIGIIAAAMFLFAVLASAANRAVDAVAAHHARPMSSVDMVMQSRQTAPVVSSGNNAMLWFAVLLIVSAVVVAVLYFGKDALREWRLTTKRRKSSPRQLPAPEPLPELPYITDIQRPQNLPQLPNYETD